MNSSPQVSVPQGKQKTQDETFAKLICKMLQCALPPYKEEGRVFKN